MSIEIHSNFSAAVLQMLGHTRALTCRHTTSPHPAEDLLVLAPPKNRIAQPSACNLKVYVQKAKRQKTCGRRHQKGHSCLSNGPTYSFHRLTFFIYFHPGSKTTSKNDVMLSCHSRHPWQNETGTSEHPLFSSLLL